MSKRGIYYQHLHFKGSKQGLSWETQFLDTPTTQSLGQKCSRTCAAVHADADTDTLTCLLHTLIHTLPITAFSRFVFHSLCHLILTSLVIHLSPSIKGDLGLLKLFLAPLFFSVTHALQSFLVFSFCLSTLILTDIPFFWSSRAVSLWPNVLVTSLSSYIIVFLS